MDLGPTSEAEILINSENEMKMSETITENEYSVNHNLANQLAHDETENKLYRKPNGKQKKIYKFETNPTIRRRIHKRLLQKLHRLADEFAVRCGVQIVVLVAPPDKSLLKTEVFGAQPLANVVKKLRSVIMEELEESMAQAQLPSPTDPLVFNLPPLVIANVPVSVDRMAQSQLRAFIPLMLKYSTGRGKPGWTKLECMPPWWPVDVVPWANVRVDSRTLHQRDNMSWTEALRHVVKCCYKYHGREDLLYAYRTLEPETVDATTSQICSTVADGNDAFTVYEITQPENDTPIFGQQFPTTTVTTDQMSQIQEVTDFTGACNVINLSTVKQAYYQDGQLIIVDEESEQKFSIPIAEVGSAEISSLVTAQNVNINYTDYAIPKTEIQHNI